MIYQLLIYQKLKVYLDLHDIILTLSENQLPIVLHLALVVAKTQQTINESLIMNEIEFDKMSNDLLKQYILLYKRTLNCPWLNPLTTDEMNILKEMEHKYDLYDLKQGRLIAIRELTKEISLNNPKLKHITITHRQIKKEQGWIGYLLGNNHDDNNNPEYLQLSEEEKLLISQQVQQDDLKKIAREAAKVAVLKQQQQQANGNGTTTIMNHKMLYDLTLNLTYFQLSLETANFNDNNKTLIILAGDELYLSSQIYTRSKVFSGSIKNIISYDYITKNTKFKELLRRIDHKSTNNVVNTKRRRRSSSNLSHNGENNKESSDEDEFFSENEDSDIIDDDHHYQLLPPSNPFMSFNYHSNPPDGVVDGKLSINLKQLEIILVHSVIKRLKQFFKSKDTSNQHINDIDINKLPLLTKLLTLPSIKDIKKAFSNYFCREINIYIEAPIIILPQDPLDINSTIIIADLGTLTVNSIDLLSKKEIKQIRTHLNSLTFTEMSSFIHKLNHHQLKKYCEHFLIQSRDISLFLTTIKAYQLHDTLSYIPLLKPIHADINISYLLYNGMYILPTTNISTTLPNLEFEVRSSSYKRLVLLIDHVWSNIMLNKTSSSEHVQQADDHVEQQADDHVEKQMMMIKNLNNNNKSKKVKMLNKNH